jgi:hypothetical protein
MVNAVVDAVEIPKPKEIEGLDDELLGELYDLTPPDISTEMPPLNPGLSKEEREEAPIFLQLKQGVMVITGEPGAGKDLTMHFILWKLKRIFKDYRVMLDLKPRPLFGKYTPFSQEILLSEFAQLDERYKTGKSSVEQDFASYSQHKEKLNEVVVKWNAKYDDLFYNCGLGLAELKRYFYNRYPHNVMNKVVSPLLYRYRHHKLLVIGTTPHIEELDVKSCLQYVTHEIVCQQTDIPGIHTALIKRRRYFNGNSIVEVTDEQPPMFIINAICPRKELDGHCFYDIYNSYDRREFSPRSRIKF